MIENQTGRNPFVCQVGSDGTCYDPNKEERCFVAIPSYVRSVQIKRKERKYEKDYCQVAIPSYVRSVQMQWSKEEKAAVVEAVAIPSYVRSVQIQELLSSFL